MRASAWRIAALLNNACNQFPVLLGAFDHSALVAVSRLSIAEAFTHDAQAFLSSCPKPRTLVSSGFPASAACSWYRSSHKSCKDTDDDFLPDEFRVAPNRNVKHLLLDPVSMLTAGRGFPLGIQSRTSDLQVASADLQYVQEDWPETAETSSSQAHQPAYEHRLSWADPDDAMEQFIATASSHFNQDRVPSWQSAQSDLTSSPPSNSAAGAGPGGMSGGSGEDGGASSDGGGKDDLSLFSQDEAELDSIKQLQKDLKEFDAVFEALAEVPWLDDSVIREREQKGMLAVAMLGTLEEAGWKLRHGVHHIWLGERDIETIVKGAPPREQAALLCVLYHTHQIEDKYGPPPAPYKPATDFFRLYEGETVADQAEGTKKTKH